MLPITKEDIAAAGKAGYCKHHAPTFHAACPQCIEAKRAFDKANAPKDEAPKAAEHDEEEHSFHK